MGYVAYGKVFLTADLSGAPTMYQPVVLNKDVVLRAVRTRLIHYNSPSFTNLSMKIYSNNGGAPGVLLHTSTNVITQAELYTLGNGMKEVGFEFNLPSLDGADTYHFVIAASGYTGDSSSHLAWQHAFPDPVYTEGFTVTLEGLGVNPYFMIFVGAEQ